MPLAFAPVDRHLRYPGLVCLLVLAGLAGLPACSESPEPHSKTLVIGVDGMEWSVMLPLLRRGELPNIEKLMDRGSYGRLGTFNPTLSPIIWTSIATGKTKEQHGIYGFDYLDERGNQHLYQSTDRRVKAVWDMLSESDLTVDVFGWWITWPAEPVSGVMVSQFSDLGQKDQVWKGTVKEDMPAQTYPRRYFDEILPIVQEVEAEFATPEDGGFADRVHELFGELKPDLTELEQRLLRDSIWSFKADETYARIAEQALEERDADLTLCYFGGTDVAGHRFWKYYQPQPYRFPPSPEALAAFQQIIPDYYRHIDSLIGRLVDKCPPDTAILLVSDHGMIPINTQMDHEAVYAEDKGLGAINSGHHPNAESGVIIAAGGPFKRTGFRRSLQASDLEMIGTVYQVTPTLLYLMKLPIGEDMFRNGILGQALPNSFVEDHPPEYIPTWDTEPERWFAIRQKRAFDGVDEGKLEQLRKLGYVAQSEEEGPRGERPGPPSETPKTDPNRPR